MTETDKHLKQISISELFNEEVQYVIPMYQRNYAWTTIEREQLIEDIKDVDEEYFLGSLVVYERDENVFEVIDGQQRLTSIFILLAALEKNAPKNTLRFEARNISNRTLEKITGDEPIYDDDFYSIELLEAYKNFKQLAKTNENISGMLHKVKLMRIIVPEDTDLNHYFEVMNTRGEQLESHEIVKARLMSKIDDDKSREKKREIFSKVWDACANMEKYVQMSFKPSERSKLFGKNLNEIKFKNFGDICNIMYNNTSEDEIEKSQCEISEKQSSLKKAILLYNEKNNSKEDNDEGAERFESIISFPHLLLHGIKLYREYEPTEDEQALDDKKLLERFKEDNKKIDPLDFICLLLKVRYLFDRYIIKREEAENHSEGSAWSLQSLKNYDSGKGKTVNYVKTFSVEEGSSKQGEYHRKILTLQSALRITYTSPKTMHWITKALSYLLKHEREINLSQNYLSFLESYGREKVLDSNYQEKKGFAIERIVYTYLDYILWRDGYNDGNHKVIPKMGEYEYTFRNSIEHFYPQQPDTAENHKRLKNDDILNHFGNLCLITTSANSKFSNQSPGAKLTNNNTIKSSQKLMVMAHITRLEGASWNENTIQDHGTQMTKLLEKELSSID